MAIFLSRVTLKFDGWPWKTIRHLLYAKLGALAWSHLNSNRKHSLKTPNSGQNRRFFVRVTSIFDEWPWKTIRHLFYATSSFVHRFTTIGEFKLELQSGVKIAYFSAPVTVKFDTWHDTWKIVGYLPYTTSSSVHGFVAICDWSYRPETLGKICFDLCDFDLRPWPFAWTSLHHFYQW